MADYGPAESVSAEGWAVALAFTGAGMIAGSLAYGEGFLQALGTLVGVAMFVTSIALGIMVKPGRKPTGGKSAS